MDNRFKLSIIDSIFLRDGAKAPSFFLRKCFIVIYLVSLQYEQNSRDNN